MRPRRHVVPLLVLTTVLLAACDGSGKPAAADGVSGTPTTSPTSSSATTGPAAAESTGAPTTSARPPQPATSSAPASSSGNGNGNRSTLCTPSGATFATSGVDGALGHFSLLVHVRNAADRPCSTTAYPGVALLDGAGHQIEQAQRTPSGYMGGLRSGTPPVIVLGPGQEATARIEGLNSDPSGSPCAKSPAFLFTLPDNTDSTRLVQQLQACPGLQVHPLLPGDTGDEG